jgi:hypothetical protein
MRRCTEPSEPGRADSKSTPELGLGLAATRALCPGILPRGEKGQASTGIDRDLTLHQAVIPPGFFFVPIIATARRGVVARPEGFEPPTH